MIIGLKGRPVNQGSYDASGKPYSVSVNIWQTQTLLTNATTIKHLNCLPGAN